MELTKKNIIYISITTLTLAVIIVVILIITGTFDSEESYNTDIVSVIEPRLEGQLQEQKDIIVRSLISEFPSLDTLPPSAKGEWVNVFNSLSSTSEFSDPRWSVQKCGMGTTLENNDGLLVRLQAPGTTGSGIKTDLYCPHNIQSYENLCLNNCADYCNFWNDNSSEMSYDSLKSKLNKESDKTKLFPGTCAGFNYDPSTKLCLLFSDKCALKGLNNAVQQKENNSQIQSYIKSSFAIPDWALWETFDADGKGNGNGYSISDSSSDAAFDENTLTKSTGYWDPETCNIQDGSQIKTITLKESGSEYETWRTCADACDTSLEAGNECVAFNYDFDQHTCDLFNYKCADRGTNAVLNNTIPSDKKIYGFKNVNILLTAPANIEVQEISKSYIRQQKPINTTSVAAIKNKNFEPLPCYNPSSNFGGNVHPTWCGKPLCNESQNGNDALAEPYEFRYNECVNNWLNNYGLSAIGVCKEDNNKKCNPFDQVVDEIEPTQLQDSKDNKFYIYIDNKPVTYSPTTESPTNPPKLVNTIPKILQDQGPVSNFNNINETDIIIYYPEGWYNGLAYKVISFNETNLTYNDRNGNSQTIPFDINKLYPFMNEEFIPKDLNAGVTDSLLDIEYCTCIKHPDSTEDHSSKSEFLDAQNFCLSHTLGNPQIEEQLLGQYPNNNACTPVINIQQGDQWSIQSNRTTEETGTNALYTPNWNKGVKNRSTWNLIKFNRFNQPNERQDYPFKPDIALGLTEYYPGTTIPQYNSGIVQQSYLTRETCGELCDGYQGCQVKEIVDDNNYNICISKSNQNECEKESYCEWNKCVGFQYAPRLHPAYAARDGFNEKGEETNGTSSWWPQCILLKNAPEGDFSPLYWEDNNYIRKSGICNRPGATWDEATQKCTNCYMDDNQKEFVSYFENYSYNNNTLEGAPKEQCGSSLQTFGIHKNKPNKYLTKDEFTTRYPFGVLSWSADFSNVAKDNAVVRSEPVLPNLGGVCPPKITIQISGDSGENINKELKIIAETDNDDSSFKENGFYKTWCKVEEADGSKYKVGWIGDSFTKELWLKEKDIINKSIKNDPFNSNYLTTSPP